MKICPKCGKVLSFNSYFGAYICTDCNWEDARIGEKRNMGVGYKLLTIKGTKAQKSSKLLCTK